MSMKSPQDLLIWCAGADPATLATCSVREQMKYATLGFTMILVAVFAGFAFGTAVHEATATMLSAIPSGVLWGVMIFSIDRLLMISIHKPEASQEKKKEMVFGAMRLLMILVVSFLVSDSALQKLFAHEIEAELAAMTRESATAARLRAEETYSADLEEWRKRKKEIEEVLENLRQEWQGKEGAAIKEAEGIAGSGIPGKGNLYHEKRESAEVARQTYLQSSAAYKDELGRTSDLIKNAEDATDQAQSETGQTQRKATGMLARNKALYRLVRSDFGAGVIFAALTLALMLVESLPLTIKLFSKRGEYDVSAELVEREHVLKANEFSKAREAEITQVTAASIQLKKAIITRTLDSATNGNVTVLTDEEKRLALQMRTGALYDLRQSFAGSRGSEDRLTYEPAAVTVINKEEEAETPFTIVFTEPREKLAGRDLIFALAGLKRESGGAVGSAFPLNQYRVTNAVNESIDPEMPLFAQIGASNRVYLSLFEPTVSHMEN